MKTHDPAVPASDNPPVLFPFQRPGWLVRTLFKAGARAYRGPAARFMGAHAMLLLTTTGRRTGLPRRTALTFQPLEGGYLVLAGMGTRSDWYRNLLARPRVEVRIGARRFAAEAEPVLDPTRRRTLAPGISAQWDRFGPPRPVRWLLRRFLGFDYDAELAYALAHAEDLPMVELVPSDPPPVVGTPEGRHASAAGDPDEASGSSAHALSAARSARTGNILYASAPVSGYVRAFWPRKTGPVFLEVWQ